MKSCSRCREVKSIKEFTDTSTTPPTKHLWCIDCRKNAKEISTVEKPLWQDIIF